MKIHEDDLSKLIRRLKRKVSKSFSRNKTFFKKYEGKIFIISNGFKDFIDPVVAPYGINSDHVFANTFTYNKKGWVIGFDEKNVLAHSGGKSKVLKSLKLDGESYVIGDGYTDYEMKEAGIAHKFFAFTENILRKVFWIKPIISHRVSTNFYMSTICRQPCLIPKTGSKFNC